MSCLSKGVIGFPYLRYSKWGAAVHGDGHDVRKNLLTWVKLAGKFRRPDIEARSIYVPLNWKISHADRSVETVATGRVSLQDLEGYLDALMVESAFPYAKLFDTTDATSAIDDADMMLLGARMSAYKGLGPLGPLAIVATSIKVHAQASLFAILAPADRPVKIFKTVAAARKWLDTLPSSTTTN